MLQLLTSQKISDIPFTFKETGIRVYSIEQALFHVYYRWRETVDDFVSIEMSTWVAEIGLVQIATKIKSIAEVESFTKRMLAFLNIINYFNEEELSSLKSELITWENRVEWERLKDQADHLVSRGESAKAIPLYTKALRYSQTAATLNNTGVAYMRLGNYEKAVAMFKQALAHEPDNETIMLTYAECLVHIGDYKLATQLFAVSKSSEANYLRGFMAHMQNDYQAALKWLESSLDSRALHKRVDIYVEIGQLENALAILSSNDHEKISEVYAAHGHARMPDAINHIKKAIEQDQNTGGSNAARLWTKLAKYYRTDYDWQRAAEAIENAIKAGVAASSATLLEYASIKKGQGRNREYQAILKSVLEGLKEQYRT